MRALLPFILLAFPFAEIYLLFKLSDQYGGWWVIFYLVVIGYLGLQLIKGEKILMGPKMMQSLTQGGNPIRAMLGTARNMIAGVLLLIPGVITDVFAVILLLIPVQGDSGKTGTFGQSNQQDSTQQNPFEDKTTRDTQSSDGDVIEGEYTHVEENRDRLK